MAKKSKPIYTDIKGITYTEKEEMPIIMEEKYAIDFSSENHSLHVSWNELINAPIGTIWECQTFDYHGQLGDYHIISIWEKICVSDNQIYVKFHEDTVDESTNERSSRKPRTLLFVHL